MTSTKYLIRNFAIVIISISLLSACDPNIYGPSSPRSNPNNQTVSAAEYARRGNHIAAARAYRKLADQSTGIQRDKYLLESAHQWFAMQRYTAAQNDLAKIRTLLDSDSQIRKILLQTRVLLELDKAPQALTSINTLNPLDSISIARPYYLLKGQTLFKLGEVIDGTKQFLARERFMRNQEELDLNRQALWFELSDNYVPGFSIDTEEEDELVIGWIELAEKLNNTNKPRAQHLLLKQWQENYPTHPAYQTALNSISTDDSNYSAGVIAPLGKVESIGVLLPLSGRLARAGEIIKQGIESANRRRITPLKINYHDTELGAINAYQEALSYQVDAVIGPLSKNNILDIANRLGGTPTLALNRIDETFGLVGLLQFGLAPEDEAALAAQFALAQGYTQALTLTSENEWGQRNLVAFTQSFEAGGGTILEQATYSTSDNDHSVAITGLLNLDESKQRYQQVRYLLGNDVEYEPRRRLDVEFIFLAAQANQARLIRPQLKFHYASRIPVFTTSHSFNADPVKNRDIDSLQMPASEWLINPFQRDALLADELGINEDTQANSQQLQLFSLGFDALNYLSHLSFDPLLPFTGLSGELSIDEFGVIHRNLPLAVIRNGKIELQTPMLSEFINLPLEPLLPQSNITPE